MELCISDHAQARMQQRSIPQVVIDLLWSFGCIEHHKGREVYSFDSKSIKRIIRYYGSLVDNRFAEKLRGCFMVTEKGTVITVAHRTSRRKTKRR